MTCDHVATLVLTNKKESKSSKNRGRLNVRAERVECMSEWQLCDMVGASVTRLNLILQRFKYPRHTFLGRQHTAQLGHHSEKWKQLRNFCSMQIVDRPGAVAAS